ncbi:amino acid ABC transporter substrate-binding protein [Candidatus Bathyarchaeota archaeon]|nr:amino acid ABC transporter substrate-binding protein [Candidatus Bathyarchaeota archaeon]
MPVSKSIAAIGMVIIAIVAFVAGLFSAPYVFPPAEEEDPVWARVLETGKIVVGSSPDWPPYEFYDEQGNWAGFEVELMEMVAERLNLTVEWREMGFETIIPEVRDMTIDLGVSGFSVTPERLDVIQFTMPHSITEGQIIMLESRRNELNITEIHSIEELADLGIQVGVQVGTTQHDELAEKAPDCVGSFR